jgi:hypothetical protein
MAFVRAVKDGNWSDTTVWHTGALPENGDTVYSNNFTVTIDQDVLIGDTNNYNVNAGSFVAGQWYQVVEIGTTNFSSIGGSNTVGSIFLATGAGTGTGIAKTIATLTNASNTAASATAGGQFLVTNGSLNIDAFLRSSSSVSLLVQSSNSNLQLKGNIYTLSNVLGHGISYGSSGTLSVIGELRSGTANGSLGTIILDSTGSGTVNVIGDVYGGFNGSSGIILFSGSSATLNVTGNVYGNFNYGYGIRSFGGSSSTINVIGDVFGGSAGGSAGDGIRLDHSGTVNIVGNVSAGLTARGILINTSGITLFVIGNVYAVTGFNGIISQYTSRIRHSGSQYDATDGRVAVYCRYLQNWNIPVKAVRQKAVDGLTTTVTYYTVDNDAWDYAEIQDVREGVSYANGNLVGTCKIPSPNNVAYNMPVDNTVGTAVLKPENVWDYLKNNIDTEGSIGERLKNAVTANDMGKLLIDTLT